MIGERIKQLRLAKGLSLSELAELSGVAKSYLSAIERSLQGNPSIQIIEKLASVLNVSVPALLLPDDVDAGENEVLDPEWVKLAQEAMNSGITKEQFREYLEFHKWRLKNGEQ
ncbi:helix-turn-helix domain-containing protein [Alicyclobacillus fastidiosus]|uniref:Helix-turn-helix domain-containing protein n=1 Tax=Alicyclobacillus fastidiosus TaxID=392011 RepID=A0ABY6ZAX2_9BACL|nr:helix-turn-helix domain-containing protein [Alicyclobacillus fastidiosus]WAH39913.1 helix-turn-helix domain-containing protein [Alicyclobacillus fastidiosus]GMA61187.1 transcriptional regulator [Alicyclobacillus fastidiosus]